MFRTCLITLSAIWVASEVALALGRRAGSTAARKDSGTLRLLNVVVYLSVACAIFISNTRYGHFAISQSILWAGLAVIVVGLALRWWAILTLGRYFSVDVAIQANHHLVQGGPYKHLRHPTYSGSLLSFLGLAVCTSNWLSALVILVPITAVFLVRIRVEERVLNEAFPLEYRLYSQRSYRLVPGLY